MSTAGWAAAAGVWWWQYICVSIGVLAAFPFSYAANAALQSSSLHAFCNATRSSRRADDSFVFLRFTGRGFSPSPDAAVDAVVVVVDAVASIVFDAVPPAASSSPSS